MLHKQLSVAAAALSVIGLILFGLSFFIGYTKQFSETIGVSISQLSSFALLLGLITALVARFMARRKDVLPHGASRIALAISGPFAVIAGLSALLSIFI